MVIRPIPLVQRSLGLILPEMARGTNWILNEQGEPQPCHNLLEWAHWLENHFNQRTVGETVIGPYLLSTVFLGVDHNFSGKGPPILWESMVFGEGPLDQKQTRCAGGREQAEALHQEMVARVEAALPKPA